MPRRASDRDDPAGLRTGECPCEEYAPIRITDEGAFPTAPRSGPAPSPRYNRAVTTFYDIDEANARIPEVRDLLTLLRDQRDALITLRDRTQEPDVDDEERRRIGELV